VTTCALGKDGVFAMQFHAQLKVGCRFAFFADAHVASSHSFDCTFVVVQNFRSSKAREDFDTECFSLLTEPACHIAQADDVVAVVLKALRQ
jgi:hypothetical protein